MLRNGVLAGISRSLILAPFCGLLITGAAADYQVVDTGQILCYDTTDEIDPPLPTDPFYGQDAQYEGHAPGFTLSQDGLTVSDNNTGLTWQQSPDTNDDGTLDSDDKLTWTEFQARPTILNAQSFGGFDDWRVPTIKELYSLIDFSGIDPSGFTGGPSDLVPFLDTDYFDFAYGDESAGERIIDAQYWSGTEYVGTVFGGEAAVFGVNFADGRIKGYPRDFGPDGTMTQFARCVRGNPNYGVNNLADNGDGTITDNSTGLIWVQADNGDGVIWEDALVHAENLVCAGHDDWRLPNAKELQSILDYTRSPSTSGSAAIDPLFACTEIINEAEEADFPCYWTGTTHSNWTEQPGTNAAYVAFGRAMGYFGPPGMESWVDVHGAGAQRSDPKEGDPDDWPYGHGPQGDAIRIFNFVLCVRDAGAFSSSDGADVGRPDGLVLQVAPNPAPGATMLSYSLPGEESAALHIFDATGRCLRMVAEGVTSPREGTLLWDGRTTGGSPVAPGIYFARLSTERLTATKAVLVIW